LHRIVNDDSADHHVLAARAAHQCREKLLEVQRLFSSLKEELAGDRIWRYERCISPGFQEYIEALGFAHYLEHGTLVTFDQVQNSLRDDDGILVRTHAYALHRVAVNVNSIFRYRYQIISLVFQI
jgi:hypothetical protein